MNVQEWKESILEKASKTDEVKEVYYSIKTNEYGQGFLVNSYLKSIKEDIIPFLQNSQYSDERKEAISERLLKKLGVKSEKPFLFSLLNYVDNNIVDISKDDYESFMKSYPVWKKKSSLNETEHQIIAKMNKMLKLKKEFNLFVFNNEKPTSEFDISPKTFTDNVLINLKNSILKDSVVKTKGKFGSIGKETEVSLTAEEEKLISKIDNRLDTVLKEELIRPVLESAGSLTYTKGKYLNGYEANLPLSKIIPIVNILLSKDVSVYHTRGSNIGTLNIFSTLAAASPIPNQKTAVVEGEITNTVLLQKDINLSEVNSLLDASKLPEQIDILIKNNFSSLEKEEQNVIKNYFEKLLLVTRVFSEQSNLELKLENTESFRTGYEMFVKTTMPEHQKFISNFANKYGMSPQNADGEVVNMFNFKTNEFSAYVDNLITLKSHFDIIEEAILEDSGNDVILSQIKDIRQRFSQSNKDSDLNKYLNLLEGQCNGKVTEKFLKENEIEGNLEDLKKVGHSAIIGGKDISFKSFNILNDIKDITKSFDKSYENFLNFIDRSDVKLKSTIFIAKDGIQETTPLMTNLTGMTVRSIADSILESDGTKSTLAIVGPPGTGKTTVTSFMQSILGKSEVLNVGNYDAVLQLIHEGSLNINSSESDQRAPSFLDFHLRNGENKLNLCLDELFSAVGPNVNPNALMVFFNSLLDPKQTRKIMAHFTENQMLDVSIANSVNATVLSNVSLAQKVQDMFPQFLSRFKQVFELSAYEDWQNKDKIKTIVTKELSEKATLNFQNSETTNEQLEQLRILIEKNFSEVFPTISKSLENENTRELIENMMEKISSFDKNPSVSVYKELIALREEFTQKMPNINLRDFLSEMQIYSKVVSIEESIENDIAISEKIKQDRNIDPEDRIEEINRHILQNKTKDILEVFEITEDQKREYSFDKAESLKDVVSILAKMVKDNVITEKIFIEKFNMRIPEDLSNSNNFEDLKSKINICAQPIFNKKEYDLSFLVVESKLGSLLKNSKNKELTNLFDDIKKSHSQYIDYSVSKVNPTLEATNKITKRLPIENINSFVDVKTKKGEAVTVINGVVSTTIKNSLENSNNLVFGGVGHDAKLENIIRITSAAISKINEALLEELDKNTYENINIMTYRTLKKVVKEITDGINSLAKIDLPSVIEKHLTEAQREDIDVKEILHDLKV